MQSEMGACLHIRNPRIADRCNAMVKPTTQNAKAPDRLGKGARAKHHVGSPAQEGQAVARAQQILNLRPRSIDASVAAEPGDMLRPAALS
jgi:hypothetical protein